MSRLQPPTPTPPPKPPQPPSPAPHPSSSPADESRLSRHPATRAVPLFQQVRQVDPIIQLRPPYMPSVPAHRKIHRLLRRCILQLRQFLPWRNQPPPAAYPQVQEVQC